MSGGGEDPLLQRLRALDACTVSDALDKLGAPGAVSDLRPLWQGAALCGRATTVALAVGPAPQAGVHLGVRAVTRARAGGVVVVDNGGRTAMGAWGGLLSLAASLRGLAGVVVDGACRDVDEARELGFPVFGRAPVQRTARGRVHEVSVGQPVRLGDVGVADGDAVLADGSGVVVVASAHLEAVIDTAESIARTEATLAAGLRAGRALTEVMGPAYETLLHERDPAPQRSDQPE